MLLLLVLSSRRRSSACSHVGCAFRCALFNELALFVPALLLYELVSVVLVDTESASERCLVIAAHCQTSPGF